MQSMKYFVIWGSVLFVALFSGCGGSSPVIADLAGEKITLNDFEEIYAKNNGGIDAAKKTSLEDKQKFLDLYVKFRLKVKEAKALGYDKDPELLKELAEYRKNLAVSYMLEKEITTPALQSMYERKLKEIRASHILLRLPDNPSPQDTFHIYNFAQGLIDTLRKGAPFEEFAIQNSQDPSVQQNKGDLYYFSAGMMVPEFEDAAFTLKPGEVYPKPVRTQFGYHVIKVTDVQKNTGPVHVAHIMKRLTVKSTMDDTLKSLTTLNALLDSLHRGGDFAALAREYSDDTFSGNRGGDLGYIDRNRTVREFDEAIFSMKDSSLSDIVRTPFGFHLIKRFDARGIPPFKEMEQQLKTEYQRGRFQHDYDMMVEKIKQQYHFSENSDTFAAFSASADTAKAVGDEQWDSTITAALRTKTAFSVAGKMITLDSVLRVVDQNPELRGLSLKNPSTFRTIFTKVGNGIVMEYHALSMQNQFPDFAKTMKEYEEGVLLFKAEQEHVWNNVQPSDSAMRLYHEQNASKYTWPDRINIQEIYVSTDSVARLVRRDLQGYTYDSLVAKKTRRRSKTPQYDTLKIAVAPISYDSAAVKYNKRAVTMEKRGVTGLTPINSSQSATLAWNTPNMDSLKYHPMDGGFVFIKVLERDPARNKTFEEAASEVSGAFQEYETKRISDAWYESLKKKYPVSVDTTVLPKAFATSK